MNRYKQYAPYAVAVILFIIITAFFFKPLVIEGRYLRQGDIQHHAGMAKEIQDFRAKEGREPLWTNSMFGGMPAYQISVLYPSNFLNPLQATFSKITLIPFPVTAIVMCMIGFYFLLITMKVNPWISIAGAIAFGLTSYMITLVPAGHNSKMYAISYMAPVLMGVLLMFRGRLWLGAGLTALALALEITCNHLQITYYLMILMIFVGIGEHVRLIREKKLKELLRIDLILLVVVAIAVLPNISNLQLTNEYVKYTTRGPSELTIDKDEHNKTDGLSIDYATQWCYTKSETMTLMIPDFMGGASARIKDYDPDALKKVDQPYREAIGSQSAYFGEVAFTSGPYYAGAIICFLFVLAMFIVRDQIKWWLLGATVLAILLSWGHHFMGLTEFFFNYIPGYNKFRAVSMTLVIVNLTLPLLAMLAIKEIVAEPGYLKKNIKKLYYSLGLTGGICLLVWLAPSAFVTTVDDATTKQIIAGVQQQGGTEDQAYDYIAQLEIAREAIVKSDAGRSFLLILLAGALIYFFVRKPFHVGILAGVLGLLIIIDMWTASSRYIDEGDYTRTNKKEVVYTPSAADNMILQDKDPAYRVLNIATDIWQDVSTSYFHKSIGGYSAVKLKRIQELYEQVLSKQVAGLQNDMRTNLDGTPRGDSLMDISLQKYGVINMFNTKYIIFNPDGGVLTNKYANGGAWFVDEVKLVANADSEIVAVASINTRTTAVVDKRYADQLNGFIPKKDPNATITVVSHQPDRIEYASNSTAEQVALFPEVFYPKGWNATIDGKEAPYFCANYILRGIRIPAGQHKIVFEFRPDGYYKGEKIAMFGSIAVFLVLIGGIFMDVYIRRKKNTAEPGA
jgi:hypothetical protein